MRPRKDMEHQDAAVRERLIRAATGLFTRKGYAATSVREIVEAAGVTKPVLYYYFGNKEGIYLKLMEEPFRRFQALMAECCHGKGGARERLMTLFDRAFLLVLEYLEGARLMYAIYYGPPQGAPFFDFDAYHRDFQQTTRELVEEGVRRGELRGENVEDMLWVIIGAFNVAMEEQLCGRPDRPPGVDRKGLQRMLLLILRGLTADGAEEVNG